VVAWRENETAWRRRPKNNGGGIWRSANGVSRQYQLTSLAATHRNISGKAMAKIMPWPNIESVSEKRKRGIGGEK
jgi:hypothetical protein